MDADCAPLRARFQKRSIYQQGESVLASENAIDNSACERDATVSEAEHIEP
jgi:hypothetical protein